MDTQKAQALSFSTPASIPRSARIAGAAGFMLPRWKPYMRAHRTAVPAALTSAAV